MKQDPAETTGDGSTSVIGMAAGSLFTLFVLRLHADGV